MEEIANPAKPNAEIVEPRYTVAPGEITNDIVVSGIITPDEAVEVKATAVGTVTGVAAQTGKSVSKGDLLFKIKIETPQKPVETRDADGNISTKEMPPKITFSDVVAPVPGTLSSVSVITDQTVAVGDVAVKIAPPTYSVSAALSAKERYRLTQQPSEALVEIKDGPAPFVCTELKMLATLAGAEPDPNLPQDAQGSQGQSGVGATTLRCAIPPEVRVFPGLAAELTIAGGKAEGVLLVPTTAVRGAADTGMVWIFKEDGTTEERAVTLGLSDGQNVQVSSGLVEGDEILEFMPRVDAAVPEENCRAMPGGGIMCEGNG